MGQLVYTKNFRKPTRRLCIGPNKRKRFMLHLVTFGPNIKLFTKIILYHLLRNILYLKYQLSAQLCAALVFNNQCMQLKCNKLTKQCNKFGKMHFNDFIVRPKLQNYAKIVWNIFPTCFT